MAIAAQINQQLERLGGRIDEINARIGTLSARLAATEKKTGWRHTARQTLGILLGIAIGAAAITVAHLARWIG